MLNLKEYNAKPALLADYLPWACLVAPGVILNKDGSFQRSARFRGPDLESATEAELIGSCARINNVLRRFGSGWALFFEADRHPAGDYPHSDFPDPVSHLVDEERRAAFEQSGVLFESSYVLTFVYLPPVENVGRAEQLLIESTGDNRRVLMLLSGTGLLLIFGATIFALDPPNLFDRDTTGTELYNVDNKPTPEGLESLPRRYSDLPKPAPELGAPLPGDLGGAVLDVERDLGIAAPPNLPFRSDPEEDAARAERIRQARIASQANESGVFFSLTTRNAAAPSPVTVPGGQNQTPVNASPNSGPDSRNPFDVTRARDANVPLELDLQNDQNLQGRKLDFLNSSVDDKIYSPHKLQDPASPYQVMAGTIISASLVTGINSDLPGQIIAQVTENIYDTVTGRYLLIPQGARMIGAYDSLVAFGQERALVVWQRIIMPDGSSVVIDNLPATDTAGYAGLEDQVDFHTWRLLKGIALSTLLGVSTELTFSGQESDLVKAIRESTQNSVNQVGQRLTERNLNIQPTITIRPGWPLRIIVHSDMVLRPYRDQGGRP